jgi:uncharacterized membrane protein
MSNHGLCAIVKLFFCIICAEGVFLYMACECTFILVHTATCKMALGCHHTDVVAWFDVVLICAADYNTLVNVVCLASAGWLKTTFSAVLRFS